MTHCVTCQPHIERPSRLREFSRVNGTSVNFLSLLVQFQAASWRRTCDTRTELLKLSQSRPCLNLPFVFFADFPKDCSGVVHVSPVHVRTAGIHVRSAV